MTSNLIDKYNAFMRGIGPWGVIFLRIGSGIFIFLILWELNLHNFQIDDKTPAILLGILAIALVFALWNLIDGLFMIFGSEGIIFIGVRYYKLRCPYCGKELNRFAIPNRRIKCGFCYQYFDI